MQNYGQKQLQITPSALTMSAQLKHGCDNGISAERHA